MHARRAVIVVRNFQSCVAIWENRLCRGKQEKIKGFDVGTGSVTGL